MQLLNEITYIPKNDYPKLEDLVIYKIMTQFQSSFTWLNHVFGKSERIIKENDTGADYTLPGFPLGNDNYISLEPNSNFGNFCFFEIDDPINVIEQSRRVSKFSMNGGIIFWLNSEDMPEKIRNKATLKSAILGFLIKELRLDNDSRLEVISVAEQSQNIYSGYSLSEVRTQYLLSPYVGLRFNFTITFQDDCVYNLSSITKNSIDTILKC